MKEMQILDYMKKSVGVYGRALYITQREEIQGYYVGVLSGAAARTGKRKEKEDKKYMKNMYGRSFYKKTQRKVRKMESKKWQDRVQIRHNTVGNIAYCCIG